MRWPWEPERIQPGDTVLRCPRCQGIECEARSALGIDVNRGGRIVGILTGHRWFCMRCGDVFCSGASGTFPPHDAPRANPLAPENYVESMVSVPISDGHLKEDVRKILPRPQRPLPLKPPTVP